MVISNSNLLFQGSNFQGRTVSFREGPTPSATVQLQGVPAAAAPSMGAAPVPPPMYVVEEPVAAAFVGASVGASVAWCEPAWVAVGRGAVAVGCFCFVLG